MPKLLCRTAPARSIGYALVWLCLGACFFFGDAELRAQPEEGTLGAARIQASAKFFRDDKPSSNPAHDIRYAPTSIEFSLSLPPTGDPNPVPTMLVFCVPPEQAVQAHVISEEGPTEGGRYFTVEDLGILRRWRLVALKMRPAFFSKFRERGSGPDKSRTVRIALEWDEPYESKSGTPFPVEVIPSRGWGRVAHEIVANPKGLSLYQIQKPEPKSEVSIQPQAPWLLYPDVAEWYRIVVTERGAYRIDLELLKKNASAPTELDPSGGRLFRGATPVPLAAVGEGVHRQIFFWHAPPASPYSASTTYWFTPIAGSIPENFLSDFDGANQSVSAVPLTSRTARFERDDEIRVQAGNFLSIQTMRWVGPPLGEEAVTFPLDFPALATNGEPLPVRMNAYLEHPRGRRAMASFALKLTANDTLATSVTFQISPESSDRQPISFSIPGDTLREGANSIALEVVASGPARAASVTNADSGAKVWLDWLEIDYPAKPRLINDRASLQADRLTTGALRWTPLVPAEADRTAESLCLVLDAAARPIATAQATERQGERGILWPGLGGYSVEIEEVASIRTAPFFQPPQNVTDTIEPNPNPNSAALPVTIDPITDPQSGADSIIITHAAFRPHSNALASSQELRGLRSRVIDVQSIYDHFSKGDLRPEAIRDFLAYTLGHWSGGAPSYVILMGDANSDYLGVARNEVRNWVPTYSYKFRDDRWASDHWLGVTSGEDDLPEFMIGRLSVSNPEDAQAVVDKIIRYSENLKYGPWRARLGFVADDGEFPPVLEDLRVDHTPAAYEPVRIYLDQSMPLEDNWYLDPALVSQERLKVSPVATARILRAFRSGVAFLTYYGHGSPNIWMDERVWFGGDSTNSDNLHLADSGHYGFVANMTCNTGAIDYPMPKWNVSISEDMMRTPNGGAAAMFVPSGPGVTSVHRRISVELRRSIFEDGLRNFGEMIALTKARYAILGHPKHLTYMYIFLGDPTVDLQLTPSDHRIDLQPRVFQPGDRIDLALTNLPLASGEYVAEIRDEKGRKHWSSGPASSPKDSLAFAIDIPAAMPLGTADFRIYLWNNEGDDRGDEGDDGQAQKDAVASARFQIALPEVRVNKIVAETRADGTIAAQVEIRNLSDIPCHSGSVAIYELQGGLASGEPVIAAFSLGPKESSAVEITWAGAPDLENVDIARAFEARVASVNKNAASDSQPYSPGVRFSVRPHKDWFGFSPELGSWERVGSQDMAQLKVTVLGPDNRHRAASIQLKDESGETILAQRMVLDEPTASALFSIHGRDVERARSGSIALVLPNEYATTSTLGGERIAQIPVAQIPVAMIPEPRARLGIADSSVEFAPERPSEGHTIFVSFDAINSGSDATGPFTAALYDGDPDEESTQLYAEIGRAESRQTKLQPGQRRRIHLRWDPIDNAGEQEIWIGLKPRSQADGPPEDRKHRIAVRVRTKPKLARGTIALETKRGDSGQPEFWLQGEVVNEGETEARNVVVTFYGREERTVENRIGEVLLAEVPANGRAVAEILWPIDPAVLLNPNVEERPVPSHEIRLRGAQQRIIRLADEE